MSRWCGAALLVAAGLLAGGRVWAADLSGTWQNVHPTGRITTSTGDEPPLLPAARAEYVLHLAAYKAGKPDFDPTQKCKPPGVTRLLFGAMPFQIIQAPQQVLFLWQWNHLTSWAKLDTAPDPNAFSTYLGNSVAHVEGNALVVESAGFNAFTFLDDAGLPHSDALRLVQRLHRDGGMMRDDITISDPKVFSATWTTSAMFRRLPAGTRLALDVCEDRVKGLNGYY